MDATRSAPARVAASRPRAPAAWPSLPSARFAAMLLLAALLAFFARTSFGADGTLLMVSGGVEIVRVAPGGGATSVRPATGDTVAAGDLIATGDDGRVQIRFTDGSIVSLQPRTRFSIEEYRFDANGQRGFFGLLQGALRTVTGTIGKRNHDDYRLITPTATVGVRGTEYVAEETVCDPACRPGRSAGLRVAVSDGRVVVTNRAGSAEVAAGSAVHAPDADSPIRATEERPVLSSNALPPRAADSTSPELFSTLLGTVRDAVPPVDAAAISGASGDAAVVGATGAPGVRNVVPRQAGTAVAGATEFVGEAAAPGNPAASTGPAASAGPVASADPVASPGPAAAVASEDAGSAGPAAGNGAVKSVSPDGVAAPAGPPSAAAVGTPPTVAAGEAANQDAAVAPEASETAFEGDEETGVANLPIDAIASSQWRGWDGQLTASTGTGGTGSGGTGSGGTGSGDAGSGGTGTGGTGTGDTDPAFPGLTLTAHGVYDVRLIGVWLLQTPKLQGLLSASGSQATLDGNRNLLTIGVCPGTRCLSRGTASVADAGVDSITTWGRWIDGEARTSALGLDTSHPQSPRAGMHYLIGIPTLTMPTSGTAGYSLMGATQPTFSDGSQLPGTFSGAAVVQFGSGLTTRVALDAQVAFSGDTTYRFTTTGGLSNPSATNLTMSGANRFDGTLAVQAGTASALGCSGSVACNASVSGGFLGPDAARLGIAYTIGAGASGTTINGVGILQRVP